MAIADDFTIDYTNKRVVHSSGTTVYTVNALYTHLQDTFDELDQMDDPVPMSAQTPTAYTMINGWFIDDESVKFLSDGAIQTTGYVDEIRVLNLHAVTNWTNFVAGDIGKILLGATTGDEGYVVAYDNTRKKAWVRMLTSDDLFDNANEAVSTVGDGGTGKGQTTEVSPSGEDLFANVYTLGSITIDPPPQIYIFQDGSSINEWWIRDEGTTDGHIDVVIKVKEAGVEIDTGDITVFARQSGDLYDHFPIDLSNGGRNAVPLASSSDLNDVNGTYILFYDGWNSDFVAGEIIEGGTSGATAEVVVATEWTNDVDGYLVLTNLAGSFTDNEDLQTYEGVPVQRATANGTEGDTFVTYDTEATAMTTLGQVVTGSSSSATRLVRGIQDDGTTGKLCLQVPSSGRDADDYKAYVDADTLTGATEGSLGCGGASITYASGFSDIVISWMNGSCTHPGTTGTFTENEVVSWNDGSAQTGIVLADSGAALELGNCTSSDMSGNLVTGADSGATCTPNQVLQFDHTTSKNFEQGNPYNYDVIIDCATRPLAEVYEYVKMIMAENSTHACYPLKYESASLAFENLDGEEYIRAYTDYDTSTNSYAPTKASPLGTFAGGVLFGAKGVWVENMASADSQNFQLLDSDNSVRVPPNFQDVKVTGLVVGDRVSVFITATGTINKTAFTSHATNNTSGLGTFEVQEVVPSHTPSSGFIRVVNNSIGAQSEERYAYTGWSGKTFTLSGTLSQNYDGTDTAYVPFIDKTAEDTEESVTVIYTSNVTTLTRVRKKGILPFEASGNFIATGVTQGAIRTTDSIVS